MLADCQLRVYNVADEQPGRDGHPRGNRPAKTHRRGGKGDRQRQHECPINDPQDPGRFISVSGKSAADASLATSIASAANPTWMHSHSRIINYALPAIASARIFDVLGRMMRGSTCSPFKSVLRTSLPEMNTGFSSLWLSIKSTRPAES